jgi:hypothetical protein
MQQKRRHCRLLKKLNQLNIDNEEEGIMLSKAVSSVLALLLVSWIPGSVAQTGGQEREMDGVMIDTCCWCGPKPPTCKAKDSIEPNQSEKADGGAKEAKTQVPQGEHDRSCVRKCLRKKGVHYVVAPPPPCPQSTVASPGYVLDEKYNALAEQYAGKMVHVRGIFDDSKHEVQVASIGPADSPMPESKERDLVAQNRKPGTVNGWVTDDKCGAKGTNDKAEACTKKCLAAGAKMVIVTDKDQKVLMVDNPDALKGHEGHHIAVTGHVMGDSIHVESAKML